jgi:uncharacterized membrane protein
MPFTECNRGENMIDDEHFNYLRLSSTHGWKKRVAIVLACILINVIAAFAIVWFPQFLVGICVGLFLGHYYLPPRKKAAK